MNDTFDDRLAALRQRFRDRAAAQSAALEEIVENLEGGASGAFLRTEIRRIAHSLVGAGGTFGFDSISECAARLDEFVVDRPDSAELPGACRTLITEIRRAATRGAF